MYNTRDLTRYFNTFVFMRKIEATILIQRWWKKRFREKKNIIKDTIIR
jgi:hypothetical protein